MGWMRISQQFESRHGSLDVALSVKKDVEPVQAVGVPWKVLQPEEVVFFGGSVGTINAGVATQQDAAIRRQTKGDGLWNRDTPLGNNGYFGKFAADGEVSTSHTILTTEGILGRDLISR